MLGLERRFVVRRSQNCKWDRSPLWYTLFGTTAITLSSITSKIEGDNWGLDLIFCIPVVRIIGCSNEWVPIFSLWITHAFANDLRLISSIRMLLAISGKIWAVSNVLIYQPTCVKNHWACRLIDGIKISGTLEWSLRLRLRLIANRARLNLWSKCIWTCLFNILAAHYALLAAVRVDRVGIRLFNIYSCWRGLYFIVIV